MITAILMALDITRFVTIGLFKFLFLNQMIASWTSKFWSTIYSIIGGFGTFICVCLDFYLCKFIAI